MEGCKNCKRDCYGMLQVRVGLFSIIMAHLVNYITPFICACLRRSSICFSDVTKLMVTAVKFFLGSDEDEENEESDDDLSLIHISEPTRKRKRKLKLNPTIFLRYILFMILRVLPKRFSRKWKH